MVAIKGSPANYDIQILHLSPSSIIIIIVKLIGVFSLAIADGFTLEFEWLHISSSIQDIS